MYVRTTASGAVQGRAVYFPAARTRLDPAGWLDAHANCRHRRTVATSSVAQLVRVTGITCNLLKLPAEDMGKPALPPEVQQQYAVMIGRRRRARDVLVLCACAGGKKRKDPLHQTSLSIVLGE